MENLEWLNEYLKESKTGEPLPYYPNLGFAVEEYEEYLALSQNIQMFKKSEGRIEITRKDSKVIINGYENINFLSNIEIDLIKNTVKTNYGVCKFKRKIKASDKQKVIGRWNGYEWTLEMNLESFDLANIDENTIAKWISVSIGKLEETNDIIMYIEIKLVENLTKTNEHELITFQHN